MAAGSPHGPTKRLLVSALPFVIACHRSVESDCSDLGDLELQCPGAANVSVTDEAKFCKAFASASAAGKCDDKNKAEFDCILSEANVCDSNAVTRSCAKLAKAASACMKAYCSTHKDDPGCANS